MPEKNIYSDFTSEQLLEEQQKLTEIYDSYRAKNLKLNMTRGVPCKEQLDLSDEMLKIDLGGTGEEIRNYGGLLGTDNSREMFRDLLGAESIDEIMVFGNSSLAIMHDCITRSMLFGVYDGAAPWSRLDKVKFLCPVPGYDRHFSICEYLGIEMVNIKLNPDGPDMDEVERLVNSDPSVKGIWCVPKYSNPDGITYSDAVIKRLACLSPAASDFRIYCDNAYTAHDLTENGDELTDLFAELKKNNKEDMLYMFASTSKITYAGGGICALCASAKNINYISSKVFIQTIGPDKINQTRHALFLKDKAGIMAHMAKHREILQPKFAAVARGFDANLGGTNLARWTDPNGGYFVSLYVPNGCAKDTITLAAGLGVALTPAGSTYPYKKDPDDSNIRIAPTFPPVSDLERAIDALCICVKLAYINYRLKGV